MPTIYYEATLEEYREKKKHNDRNDLKESGEEMFVNRPSSHAIRYEHSYKLDRIHLSV